MCIPTPRSQILSILQPVIVRPHAEGMGLEHFERGSPQRRSIHRRSKGAFVFVPLIPAREVCHANLSCSGWLNVCQDQRRPHSCTAEPIEIPAEKFDREQVLAGYGWSSKAHENVGGMPSRDIVGKCGHKHRCIRELFGFCIEPPVSDTDTPQTGRAPGRNARVPDFNRNLIGHTRLLVQLVPRNFVFGASRILRGTLDPLKHVRVQWN